jgi:hypothetical protein
MKTIQQLVNEHQAQKNKTEEKVAEHKTQVSVFSGIKTLMNQLNKGILDNLKTNVFQTIIKNFPKEMKVSNIDEMKEGDAIKDMTLMLFLHQLQELKDVLELERKGLQLPDVQKVEITNQKDVKIPEPPKSIDVRNIDEMVYAIEQVEDAVKKIKITFPDIKIPQFPSKISVDNLGIISKSLDILIKEVKKLQTNQPEIVIPDNSKDIVFEIKKLEEILTNLRFPVPNFRSSYQNSLSMRLQDETKTFVYDGSNVDYVEATHHGKTYRKTFTYSGDNITGVTNWEEQ